MESTVPELRLQSNNAVQTGYAVVESMRRSGVGTDIVSKGIEEMRQRFRRQGAETFYIEAAVVLENVASNRLSKSLLSESPRLSRRLHHLREWSHGKYVKEIFS
jgi:hypothetical protein